MQWTLRRSVGVNVGAEFRVVIKIGVLNALGGEFESLRPASVRDCPTFRNLLILSRPAVD